MDYVEMTEMTDDQKTAMLTMLVSHMTTDAVVRALEKLDEVDREEIAARLA